MLKGKRNFRQGDVILKRIDDIPPDVKEYKRDERNRALLALGEVTGHAHAISSDKAKVFGYSPENLGLEKYLEVTEEAALTHEEHATINIAPGKYHVIIQRVYSPEEIRNVVD